MGLGPTGVAYEGQQACGDGGAATVATTVDVTVLMIWSSGAAEIITDVKAMTEVRAGIRTKQGWRWEWARTAEPWGRGLGQ